MAHKEAEIVRWHLSFKSETTYSLMAHEEAGIVRWHLSFKERDHLQPDQGKRT
jgi:hypothetical protein